MSPQAWLDSVVRDNPKATGECSADGLWPLVADLGFVQAWLQEKLACMAQHPADLPGGYADPVLQSLMMLDDGRVHLSLAIVDAAAWQARRTGAGGDPGIIDFAAGWTRIKVVIADDLVVQHHELISAKGSLQAIPTPPLKIEPGQEFALANATEALRFTHVGADAVILRLVVRDPLARQAVECDSQSGAVVRIRQAQSHEGRIRMTLSLLRSLGVGEAVSFVRDGMPDWPAHLRWHAVMEALALESRAGFALLEDLLRDDPDPQIRRQASRLRDSLLARYPDLRDPT